MTEAINEILVLLFTAAGLAFIRILWPWVKNQTAVAEAKLRNTDHELAAAIVREAVEAAEQMIQGEKTGDLKREKAVDMIYVALEEKGIKVSAADINRMIEAFVAGMNKK